MRNALQLAKAELAATLKEEVVVPAGVLLAMGGEVVVPAAGAPEEVASAVVLKAVVGSAEGAGLEDVVAGCKVSADGAAEELPGSNE